jgi:hypothetical protein
LIHSDLSARCMLITLSHFLCWHAFWHARWNHERHGGLQQQGYSHGDLWRLA